MKSRYSFFDKVEDEYLGIHPGLLEYNDLKKFLLGSDESYYYSYKIPLVYQYRPDLIAYNLLGSVNLQWVLTYINEIENSPEGYTINRIITVPVKERLLQII